MIFFEKPVWADFEFAHWNERTQEEDLVGSKIHAFKPYERRKKYTDEKYISNRSLCGKFSINVDGDEQPSEWEQLKKGDNTHDSYTQEEIDKGRVCLNCLKSIGHYRNFENYV